MLAARDLPRLPGVGGAPFSWNLTGAVSDQRATHVDLISWWSASVDQIPALLMALLNLVLI